MMAELVTSLLAACVLRGPAAVYGQPAQIHKVRFFLPCSGGRKARGGPAPVAVSVPGLGLHARSRLRS